MFHPTWLCTDHVYIYTLIYAITSVEYTKLTSHYTQNIKRYTPNKEIERNINV